jgi:hypothetical protein
LTGLGNVDPEPGAHRMQIRNTATKTHKQLTHLILKVNCARNIKKNTTVPVLILYKDLFSQKENYYFDFCTQFTQDFSSASSAVLPKLFFYPDPDSVLDPDQT